MRIWSGSGGYRIPTALVVDITITIILLIAETRIYFLLRKKQLNRLWVRMHIGLLYFTLIGIPILYVITTVMIRPTEDLDTYRANLGKLMKIRAIIFWISVILAHVFFIMTLIKGFARQPQEELPEGEEGILDDFREVQ